MPRPSVVVASILFTGAGTLHFVRPDVFEAIVPDWVPSPRWANRVSGALEIVFGLGLLLRRTRRWSALGLVGLLVAVFPANLDMALNDVRVVADPDRPGRVMRSVGTADGTARLVNWLRLPLQVPLAWWMWREARAADHGRTR